MIRAVGRAQDLTGHRYGLLTVLSFHSKIGLNRKWNCRCDCGKECVKYVGNLKSGNTVSCGCVYKTTRKDGGIKNFADLNGKRFGRLLVIERAGSNKHKKATWRCRCDCGGEKIVPTGALMSENTASCGCIQKETMHKIRWNPNLTDEYRKKSRSRGHLPENHLWCKAVRDRDGWKCQVCKTTERNTIIAHHINSWKTHPDERFVVANGVTLCRYCHCDFHRKYGYKNTTLKQWNEFIASKKEVAA